MTKEALIREAFLLGFMVSREGFNAECPYDHLAPTDVEPHHGGTALSERAYREMMDDCPGFESLLCEAVGRLAQIEITP